MRLTVEEKVIGKTPEIIGINTGEMPAGSAFPEWVRAMEVNGARLRLNVAPAKEAGEKISSLNDLEREARRLRSAAKQETPKLWTHPSKLAASSLEALRKNNINLLATITCPFAYLLLQPDGKTNWSQAWRYWQAYYAEAYQLASLHQVRRFQLFNEPNHRESAKLTQEEYTARMAIGCDAIQAALTDAARDGGAKLEPLISAPCTAGISVFTKTGKPDARDDKIGWGELSLRDRHLRMNGKNESGYAQFQQYAVQHYSANPVSWLEQLKKLYGLIQNANAGQPLPVVMSEFNIHTARDFAKRATTMDSPEEFPDVGSMAAAIAESGLTELYFFRLTLSKNLDEGGVKKNGVHHVNEEGTIPEITGTTLAAEVIRLAAIALRNEKDLLEVKGPATLRAAATRQDGEVQLLLARTNSTTKPELEVTLPSSTSGSLLTWETVALGHFGTTEILDSAATLHLSLPSTSVGLLRSRPFQGVKPNVIPSSASFSTDATRLATGGTTQDQTLFEFSIPSPTPKASVFLHLQAKSSPAQSVPVHLYSVTADLPDALALKMGSFPFRKKDFPQPQSSGLTVQGLGKDIEWIRGFTLAPSQREVWVEITSVLPREPKSQKSLLLTRDLRHKDDLPEAEPVEWQSAELVLYPR